jgi:hypothetical protein
MSDLGEAALGEAEAAYQRGVKESGGLHRGPEVDDYLARCVRGGKFLGLRGMNWCAASASDFVWTAWARLAGVQDFSPMILHWQPSPMTPPRPPIGYRAAVSELVADARASGAFHDVSAFASGAFVPSLGDLAILGRAGEDPRTGGLGHVCLVASDDHGGGAWDCVGGNQGTPGAVTLVRRSVSDAVEPIVGFVAL